MDEAKSGSSRGPGGAKPNSGYEQKKKSILENKQGGTTTFKNQDFDPDKNLEMEQDEMIDDDALSKL